MSQYKCVTELEKWLRLVTGAVFLVIGVGLTLKAIVILHHSLLPVH